MITITQKPIEEHYDKRPFCVKLSHVFFFLHGKMEVIQFLIKGFQKTEGK